MWSGSWPLIIRSERQIAQVSGFSSCPYTSSTAFGLSLLQVFLGDGEHPAGAARRVVQGADRFGAGQGGVVLREQDVHHQPDHLAGGEVLTRGFVAHLREAAQQFLEDVAHRVVGDGGLRTGRGRRTSPRSGRADRPGRGG